VAILGTIDALDLPAVNLWSDPIATNVTDPTDIWDLSNFTVDAHPIHVHLVKYNVAGRIGLDGKTSIVFAKDSKNGGLQAWENGWKDRVIAYLGEVTSVAANFDIPGLYIWHYHIVEHEDNKTRVSAILLPSRTLPQAWPVRPPSGWTLFTL
jgi:hypothetical protein